MKYHSQFNKGPISAKSPRTFNCGGLNLGNVKMNTNLDDGNAMLDALATLIETQIQTTPELAAPLRLRMQRIFKTEDHTAPPSDLYEQAIGYASVLLALDLKEKGRQSATTLSAISAARRFVKAQMATAMEMAKENKAA